MHLKQLGLEHFSIQTVNNCSTSCLCFMILIGYECFFLPDQSTSACCTLDCVSKCCLQCRSWHATRPAWPERPGKCFSSFSCASMTRYWPRPLWEVRMMPLTNTMLFTLQNRPKFFIELGHALTDKQMREGACFACTYANCILCVVCKLTSREMCNVALLSFPQSKIMFVLNEL